MKAKVGEKHHSVLCLRLLLYRKVTLLLTMFDISVDQYFDPSRNRGRECRKRIDAMLNALDKKNCNL